MSIHITLERDCSVEQYHIAGCTDQNYFRRLHFPHSLKEYKHITYLLEIYFSQNIQVRNRLPKKPKYKENKIPAIVSITTNITGRSFSAVIHVSPPHISIASNDTTNNTP